MAIFKSLKLPGEKKELCMKIKEINTQILFLIFFFRNND